MKELKASRKRVAKAVKEAEAEERGGEVKASEVTLFLFGKPAWDLKGLEGKTLTDKTIEAIRDLGAYHKAWLERAAEIAKKLKDGGWKPQGGLYDITAYKEIPLGAARKELRGMGISLKEVSLRDAEE